MGLPLILLQTFGLLADNISVSLMPPPKSREQAQLWRLLLGSHQLNGFMPPV
ncbi:MAG: hypothetical protein ABSH41_17655 [Syntrophobacteraceae bacterium]